MSERLYALDTITTPQYRLAYHVDDSRRVVTLLAVSSRDDVYALLAQRLA